MRRAVSLIVLWMSVLSWQPAVGIMNQKANSSNVPHFYPRREYFKKKSYLKVDRPLWVLEDKVSHSGEIEVATHKPLQRKPIISSTSFHHRLPSHYSNLDTAASTRSSLVSSRELEPRQRTRMFPVFEEADTSPILIYRGPKAEMIFNTMMTNRKYPMKEPVPGQVLYPPYSPRFKPTPVVERVRSNTYPNSFFHNVTLIPFYPHEAIDPRQIKYEPNFEPAENSIAHVEVDNNPEESQNYLTQEDPKPACYHSYYSQDDVQSQYWTLPYSTTSPVETTTQMSLIRSVPIPNGIYSNHRMEATTPMAQPSEDSFRIMYPSDIDLAAPKRYRSVHTAKYGGFKTMYPIYTLNKLLKVKPQKILDKPSSRNTRIVKRTLETTQHPEETWLIWNTRSSNFLNPLSSRSLSTTHHSSAAAIDTKILVE